MTLLKTITCFSVAAYVLAISPNDAFAQNPPVQKKVVVQQKRVQVKRVTKQAPTQRTVTKNVTKQTTKTVQKTIVKQPVKTITKTTTPILKNAVPLKTVTPNNPQFLPKNGLNNTLATKNTFLPPTKLVLKPTPAIGFKKGRIGLPPNVTPRFSLLKAPPVVFKSKFSPFVQRHWKGLFFWTFVAGIGYVTVPEVLYDRWVVVAGGPEPDYDACVTLLSSHAVIEDGPTYERVSVPADVSYRYRAPVSPNTLAATVTTNAATATVAEACKFEPFVQRKWDRSFVWVQIPDVGSITVPEDHYERFFKYMSAATPDYPGACNVLVEAAAADSVVPEVLEQ